MVEVGTRRAERLAGLGPGPRILGIIETSPVKAWTWRDRRFVLRALKGTVATHYVYASEADPLLGEQWREPFPDLVVDRFAELVEARLAVLGIALAPCDLVDDDPDQRAALAAKVDQVLDVGFELVVLRFDRPGAGGDAVARARLVAALADHVGGRADLVVVPGAITETWPTDELTTWEAHLPEDVMVAWCGIDHMPASIGAGDLARRAAAVGDRPPFVWDAYALNNPLAVDRLPVGPYVGRDPAALRASAGWLVTAPAVARVTIPFLGPFSTWADGGDPEVTWREEGGDLRVFVEACEGSVPKRLVDDLVGALGGPHWSSATARLHSWMAEASQVSTPLLGHEVAPWRRQVRDEAAACLLAALVVQLAHPLVLRDDDGTVRVLPPDLENALPGAAYLAARWKALVRKPVDVMGHRLALYPRVARSPDGAPTFGDPFLVEGENATDHLVRAVLSWLPSLRTDGGLVVEVDGEAVPVAPDHTVATPAGATVVARVGAASTAAPPGWVPPLLGDPRLLPPGGSVEEATAR